jgi:DNA repair protein RecO (recombination protein O)
LLHIYTNTTGLILRETAYKESSKILTILTSGHGKLTVTARGALRKNSKLAAVTGLLAFSEMTLFLNRDRWTMTEARCVEQFMGLRDDLALLSLGSYFAELAEAVADEDSPNTELLPLCLNALFALSEGIKPPELVKPAFELRLMAIAGFAPLLDNCSKCGMVEPENAFMDIDGGVLLCEGCSFGLGVKLSRGALHASRYIVECEQKRIYSFTLAAKALKELSNATEKYLLSHLDRSFRTLDYYKDLGYRI